MRFDPDREIQFEEALSRIAELPPTEGLDVLLHYFLGVVNGMDLQAARAMRDELTNRFGGRYCSSQICRMMADLVNGHLAMTPSEVCSRVPGDILPSPASTTGVSGSF